MSRRCPKNPASALRVKANLADQVGDVGFVPNIGLY
jgi:hypothetical protein